MPHISAAMSSSLRRGVGEILVDSLLRRTITSEVSSVKNTFSSWDNCMAQTYCKWPVIAAIIIAGLIVISVVTCLARCLCCGMSCCCSCFRCLRCCDCCGDCCEGKKEKPMKHLDEPFGGGAPSNQGYQAPAPMMGGALGGLGVRPEPPKYAQFEVGKSGLAVDPPSTVHEDALPPMPSWETAAKKHVLTEDEKNAVELGELDPTTGQKVPLMSGAAVTGVAGPPSPAIPHSPYGAPGQANGGNGYASMPGEFPPPQNGFNPNQRAFNGSPAPGPGQMRGYNGSPGPGQMRNGRGQGFGGPQQQGYDGQDQFGQPSRSDSYSQNDPYGAPISAGAGGYGRAQPQRQYSSDSRPFPPGPNRQYSNDSSRPLNPGRQYSDRSYDSNYQPQSQPPRGPSRGPGPRMASPPLNNNSGFDFNGTGAPSQQYPPDRGYQSRSPPAQQRPYQNTGARTPPAQNDYYDRSNATPAPTYASRTPPPQEPAYPGYKPYQPPTNSATRGGREPQGWDPVHQ